MDIQDVIFRFPLTPLAGMPITEQHILAHIPEAELWPFLIRLTRNVRIAYSLKIELSNLNRCSAHWQNLVSEANDLQMGIDLVSHRRSKPALRFPSVEKPCLAVAR